MNFKAEFCVCYLMMAISRGEKCAPGSITKFGCEVNIKTMQENEFLIS